MFISIDEIRVRKRVRADEGDISSLMTSLKKFGQLNPIIVDTRYELIAGARRLEAAKRLGWSTIKAIVVENPTDAEKLEIELVENVQRKDLTSGEISWGLKRLHKLLHPNIFMRFVNFIRKIFRMLFGRKRRV